MQQSVPRTGRNLPGMPLEMEDPDGNEEARPGVRRFTPAKPASKWWRPASAAGRVFVALGALVVLSGLTASALMLRTYLERDARFRIAGAANIQAAGLTEMSRSQMLAVFGEDIGRNVFFVPLDERRRELEAIPWVERATVMRLLPDQIRVSVVERKPVAFTRQGQLIGLVDADGVLLAMPAADMARHHYSFPVVTGIDPGDPAASRQARMAVYQRLMGDLDSNGQHLSEQISEIDLTDPEDARVLMPEQGTDILAHFGEDHFIERYQRYQAHIAEWRQQYPHLAAVDLRYDQQAVLEMASGKEASETTPGAPAAGGEADAKPPAGEAPANAKPAAETAQKKSPGSRVAKAKSAPDKKKRADAGHTALNEIRRNPAHATSHAATAAEGQ
jgi:cell division protein FtsQ